MKKSTKLISLILAVVMVFSASCISVAASAIPSAAQNSVEQLVKNENLAQLVTWLIKNLNDAKGNITGTVLKLVYMFLPKDSDNDMMKSLTDRIAKIPDVTNASEEQLANVLVEWLDKDVLPDLGSNIPDWLSNLANFIGLTVDLSSVDKLFATLVSAGGLVNGPLNFGILEGINVKAVDGVKRSGGDTKVIYAVFQFLADNTGIIEKALKGNLDLGIVGNFVDVSEYEDLIKNIGVLAKSYIYLLIDGHAKGGEFKKDNMAGDWGTSAYKDYSADQMLAAALIKIVNDTDEVISKADADKALGTSFYGLLAQYGPVLYSRFAVDFLNGTLKDLIGKLKDYPEAAKAFNMNYTFTKDSFNSAFTDANSTGFLGQFNNIICIILKTILSNDAYQAIAPEEGGNDKLNGNLTKMCRYVLPILAAYSDNLGFDFTKFTADAVKEMELPEMAVAVLKIFFPTWFKDAYNADKALLNNAATLAQMGAVAMKYVVQNPDLLNWFTNGFSVKDLTDQITADKIAEMDDATCIDLAATIGARLGAYALDENKNSTHFTLNANAATWTWEELCDDIVDWAINFVKGLPAVAVKHITAKMGELDGYGPFYKINVVLNELIDFSFLSDVNDATFKLDVETLLFDTIVGNTCNFDVAAILKVFEVNTKEGNFLNGPVIKGVIGIVDRILTALFSHTCGASGDFEKELDCTHALTGSYDKFNGHYLGTPTEKAIDTHNFVVQADKKIEATCGKQGTEFFKCSKCGEEKTETIPATGAHTWELTEEDKAMGIQVYTCSVCGEEKIENVELAETVPANLGDVNNDGKVGSDDARLALRASVKLEKDIVEGTAAYLAADINGDKAIKSDDARTILRLSVKLENMDDIKAKYGK